LSDSPVQPPLPTYEDLAGLVEYALVAPQLSEEDVNRGCELAKTYQVACVIVRPSDADLAARWLSGSGVRLGALVDSPHGYSATAAKLFAARDQLRRGAREIETVMNTGKLVSRQFQFLEMELLQMADACHESAATLSVNLESEYLTEELKIVACRILKRAGADYVGANNFADVALLRNHARERIQIKAFGPIAGLEDTLAFRDAGCSRLQLADPAHVLEAWKAKLAAQAQPAP
jgi:deoxyribose-phosphate aldolase